MPTSTRLWYILRERHSTKQKALLTLRFKLLNRILCLHSSTSHLLNTGESCSLKTIITMEVSENQIKLRCSVNGICHYICQKLFKRSSWSSLESSSWKCISTITRHSQMMKMKSRKINTRRGRLYLIWTWLMMLRRKRIMSTSASQYQGTSVTNYLIW